MIVGDVIEDVEGVLKEHPEAVNYDIAIAAYEEDGTGLIKVRNVEAYHWDDDEEFFLIPAGAAHHYNLEAIDLKASELLKDLKGVDNKEIHSFVVFARAQIKVLGDGSVASLNSPLWGTGVHHEAKLIYFYHGMEPNAS